MMRKYRFIISLLLSAVMLFSGSATVLADSSYDFVISGAEFLPDASISESEPIVEYCPQITVTLDDYVYSDSDIDSLRNRYISNALGWNEGRSDSYFSGIAYASSFNEHLFNNKPLYKAMYNAIKNRAVAVAAGTESNTKIQIPFSEIYPKELTDKNEYLWYADSFNVDNGSIGNMETFKSIVSDWLYDNFINDGDFILEAAKADCPYEFFWASNISTSGTSGQYALGRLADGRYYADFTGVSFQVAIEVNKDYRVGDPKDYKADTDKISELNGKVEKARTNAKKIVEDAHSKNLSDYDTLVYYMQKTKEYSEYDHMAASNPNPTSIYGDPWQLISLYDGDPSTKVVCEGFSKGYMYLLELHDSLYPNSFKHNITYRIVEGTMVAPQNSGDHMWNVVSIDGKNYMVDITNCDAELIDKSLFLSGYTNKLSDYKYTFDNLTYNYDELTKRLYSKNQIVINGESYSESTTPSTPDPTPSTPDPTPSTPDPTPSTPDPTPSTPDPTPSTPDPTPSTPEPIKVTVNFNPQGGNLSFLAKQVVVGDSYGVLPTPYRPNYTFGGWFTGLSDGNSVNANSIVTNKLEHTLYARWTYTPPIIDEYYNVQFDYQGGIGGTTSRQIKKGGIVGTLPIPYERDGYNFEGWYSSPIGGQPISSGTEVYSNLTVYAHWQQKSSSSIPSTNPDTGNETTITNCPAYLVQNPVITIDGVEYNISNSKINKAIANNTKLVATSYTYSGNIPVGMTTWLIEKANNNCAITQLTGFNNLLTYQGCTVRVSGNTGLRFVSSIDTNLKNTLKTTGLNGYKIKELGVLYMKDQYRKTASNPTGLDLVIGGNGVSKARCLYTSGSGYIDYEFLRKNGQTYFASTMTGIPAKDYATMLAFRTYCTLTKDGVDYNIYGPIVSRSLYSVTNQVLSQNSYSPYSNEYRFLKNIADTVAYNR